jgi:hypothetical protein
MMRIDASETILKQLLSEAKKKRNASHDKEHLASFRQAGSLSRMAVSVVEHRGGFVMYFTAHFRSA